MKFTEKEIEFIKSLPVARIATISEKRWPQLTPVLHVFDGKDVYFATDYETKKYENLKKNSRVAVVIDKFPPTVGATIQGEAEIIERGKEFEYAFKLLQDRHTYYKKNPFKEGEAPIIKVKPLRKISWGLD